MNWICKLCNRKIVENIYLKDRTVCKVVIIKIEEQTIIRTP